MMEEEAEGFTFIWKIENFYACRLDVLQSSWFFPRVRDQPTSLLDRMFRLKLIGVDQGELAEDNIQCELQCCDKDGGFCLKRDGLPCVNFTVSFVKNDGSYDIFYAGQVLNSSYVNCLMKVFKNNVDICQDDSGYFQEETLTIRCHLWNCKGCDIPPLRNLCCLAYSKIFVEQNIISFKIDNDNASQSERIKTIHLSHPSSYLKVVLRRGDQRYEIYVAKSIHDERVALLCTVRIQLGESIDLLYHHWLPYIFLRGQFWKFPNDIDLQEGFALPCKTFTVRLNLQMCNGKHISWVEKNSESDILSAVISSDQLLSKKQQTIQTIALTDENPCKPAASDILLQAAMWNMYKERKLCDFALTVDRSTFPVHMAILGGRSPVFCAMFEASMKEKESKMAEITDLDIPTVEGFLRYLYCDVLEDMDLDRTIKMYFAADKYQVDDLKSKCSSILESGLSPESVCRVLGMADMHQDHRLMEAAKTYTFKNAQAIFSSEEWKQFKSENLQLVCDVMIESFSISN